MIQKPLKDFKYLADYNRIFPTSENTVYAYDGGVYCDKEIPPDILIHEKKHLDRQKKLGADKWVKLYLQDEDFRKKEEVIAYRHQIQIVKDRELQNQCRIECARNLSSLYKLDLTYNEAIKLLM